MMDFFATQSQPGEVDVPEAEDSSPPSRPIVSIDDVEAIQGHTEVLAGASLDAPIPGYVAEAYSFPLEGWAVGASSPVASIRMLAEDGRDGVFAETVPGVARPDVEAHLGTSKAGLAGFSTSVSTLGLPSRFELFACARLADGTEHRFAVIRGRTQGADLRGAARASPLLVNTTGRTGSTWLMRLLGLHPGIISYRPFEYEPRLVSYWCTVLLSLGAPASYLQPLAARLTSGRWWLGDETGPGESPVPSPFLADLLGRDGIERLAEFVRERIDSFYEAVANDEREPGFELFAEKVPPERQLMEAATWLYPDARRVYLVRDPRDIVLSVLAYGERRRTISFGRELVTSDEEFVREVAGMLEHIVRLHKADPGPSLLIRYEDLILSPDAELHRMFSALGVESDEAIIRQVIAGASEELPGMKKHRTAPDVHSSVGRWRRDLPLPQQQAWTEELSSVLALLAYDEDGA